MAYRNSTCETVANNVRQLLNKKLEYEVGEILICRKWFKIGTTTFNVNYEYTVIATDESGATLDDGINLTCSHAEEPLYTQLLQDMPFDARQHDER